MKIQQTSRGFEVSFQYSRNIVDAIKKIDGAWYRSADRVWVVPRHKEAELSRFRQKFGEKEEVNPVYSMPEIIEEVPPLPSLSVPLDLRMTPFPYQTNGIAYNIEKKRAIIGDEPGLGKTLQAIATIHTLEAYPVLVVCPSTLKLNWQKEWNDVAGKRAMILNDRVKNTWQQYHKVGMIDVFIVNYESLKKFFVQSGWSRPKDEAFRLDKIPFRENISVFKSLIIDEAHKCKDGSTQQAKFVMGLARNKEVVLALTGTPAVNKPLDLVSQLHIIDRLKDVVAHIPHPLDKNGNKSDLSGYKRFLQRYCDGGSGASNLRELNYRLNVTCFYRRRKSEVLADLPAKMRQVLLCEIDNRKEYEHAENEFVDYLKSIRGCDDKEVKKKLRGQFMVKMGILKQISALGKINEAKDYIDEVTGSGEKIVVFCSLREIGDKLKAIYPGAVMIRGGMTDEEKNRSLNRFQNDPETKVIICSIKAAGVGLTLTASSRVLFIEFPWTDADCNQCEDRTHRIGQKNSVLAAYLLGENTIDRYCYEIIQKKKTMAQTITGDEDIVEEEIVDQLLNLFNQRA
jgi:SWI/SNF-related matrix-associated actin-dependent regulator of chromatin subfamily A-like protein 1